MKDSQKDSPEHQRGLCEEKSRTLELNVQYIYEDRDSGTSIIGREEIKKLIKDAKAGLFNNIIFASMSRFSRDTLDSLNLKRVLVDALGLRLISIEEGFDSAKDNDELKFQIISAVNQKLSEQISLSSKRGIRQSAIKGNFTGSITPYGYVKVVVGERKTLVPDEDTKSVVQLIYNLYTTQKKGEKAIVNYLNEEQIPAQKGGIWGLSSVQRILMNEVYTGENVFSKYEVKKVYNDINNMSDRSKKQVERDKSKWERSGFKTHEPIIEEETFNLAQELRLQRGGGKRGGIRNKVNVFAGFIFCAHCGSAMVSMKSKGVTSKKEGIEYRYLICSARRRQGEKGCINNLWLPYEEFRDNVIKDISEKLKKTINVEIVTEQQKGKIVLSVETNYDKEIKKLEKNIEANRKLVFEIRKQKMLGEIDDQQYAYEKGIYEKEIDNQQVQLNKINQNVVEKVNLEKIYEEISAALNDLVNLRFDQFEEVRLLLQKIIKRILVSQNGNVDVLSPLGNI